MATWGGKRKGSGRPKGVKTKDKASKTKKSTKKSTEPEEMTPLEYLTSVMNDPETPQKDRIRAAIAAARYSHKLGDRNAKEEKTTKVKRAVKDLYSPSEMPERKVNK